MEAQEELTFHNVNPVHVRNAVEHTGNAAIIFAIYTEIAVFQGFKPPKFDDVKIKSYLKDE